MKCKQESDGNSKLPVCTGKELVHVTVGHEGTPSYGQASQGVVIVMWGDLKLDDLVKRHEDLDTCIERT